MMQLYDEAIKHNHTFVSGLSQSLHLTTIIRLPHIITVSTHYHSYRSHSVLPPLNSRHSHRTLPHPCSNSILAPFNIHHSHRTLPQSSRLSSLTTVHISMLITVVISPCSVFSVITCGHSHHRHSV